MFITELTCEFNVPYELKKTMISEKMDDTKIGVGMKREAIGTCPKCGGQLSVRINSKDNSRFLGCTNFSVKKVELKCGYKAPYHNSKMW